VEFIFFAIRRFGDVFGRRFSLTIHALAFLNGTDQEEANAARLADNGRRRL